MKKITSITLVVLLVSSMSSCKLFRGKNKCDTCPSWSMKSQKTTENTSKVKA